MSSNELHWGIDLGGTKIEGAVLDHDLNELFRDRIPTEGAGGYNHILGRIRSLVEKIERATESSPTRIGFGTPGTLDGETGLLRGSNTIHLNGHPLDADLHNLLGCEVSIENDANCFALAESRLGAAADLSGSGTVFGIIMGTGVGSGIVVNGQLVKGRNAIAGEWGHNFLDESGGECYCGRTGCVETVISGPATEQYFKDLAGTHLSLADINNAASEGQAHAVETINRLARFFGRAVATVINILDPDVIVIGGGVGNIDALYSQGIDEARKHVFTPKLQTRILRPKLGDSAGVLGAALL